jgi:DNA-binding response OmpR family regulator
MTAVLDAQDWADDVGADAYVAKPFDLTDLLDHIAELM